MTVAELIKNLQTFPQDKQVQYVWDGDPRSIVDFVWLARNKEIVVLSGEGEYVSEDFAPDGAVLRDNSWDVPLIREDQWE